MCGIVLAGGNMSSSDLEIFNQLLYCDVFRGQHSTGVYCKRLNENYVRITKDALPSYAFLLGKDYEEMSRGLTNYCVAPLWMVGHNRHATRGAVNAENAHPFQHGNITLVHNGTLTDQSLLPDHNKFVVDSNNICYSIDKIGAAETIQKLDGAYTLIWHDNSDDTLHIIRNEERPFHLCRVGQDWFGASEEDMLMWILKRSKTHKNRIGEHFECKVGVEYIFDVSGPSRKMQLVEEKEHKLPVFTVASRWANSYSGRSWLDDYDDELRERQRSHASSSRSGVLNHNSQSQIASVDMKRKEEIKKQNQIAVDAGLKVRRDQLLEFTPCMFVPYEGAHAKGKGKMTGYVFDEDVSEYFEIDVHNILESDYNKSLEYPKSSFKGTVSCIHKTDNMIRCVMVNGKFLGIPENKEPEGTTAAEFDDDIPFDMNATCTSGAGVVVTRKFWESHSHAECGGCGKHIDWADAPKAAFAYQAYWHPDCFRRLSDDNDDDAELAVCSCCSKLVKADQLDEEMAKYRQDDVCKECAEDVRKKAAKIRTTRDYAWGTCVDRTSPRTPEFGLRVTQQILNRMIVMPESIVDKGGLTLDDIPGCYIEKRAGGMYAIAKLPNGVKTPYEKKGGTSATKAETFPSKPKPLSLRKIVKSIDGSKELSVNKAIWGTVGFCEFCYKQIPWKDVEACTLGDYNRIVCPSEICRGKSNGSKKNSA